MVHAIGLDIVEVDRISQDIGRYGDSFVRRILSVKERESFLSRADRELFLAGRFACKEAVIKALGFRLKSRPSYIDLEIINNDTGLPVLNLPEDIQQELGLAQVMISITHEKSYAAAVALITEDT